MTQISLKSTTNCEISLARSSKGQSKVQVHSVVVRRLLFINQDPKARRSNNHEYTAWTAAASAAADNIPWRGGSFHITSIIQASKINTYITT